MEGGGSAIQQEQILNTRAEISAAKREIKAADTKVKHNTDQLKKNRLGALGKYEKIKSEEGMEERLEGEPRTLTTGRI